MKTLETIGIVKGWIYEVIVSTYAEDRPHSAPFGFWTNDFTMVCMEIYKSARTIQNILQGRDFTIALTADVETFCAALFHKNDLSYCDALKVHAPVLKDVQTTIECRLTQAEERTNSFLLVSRIVHLQAEDSAALMNRARALTLESLILATKLGHLPATKIVETLEEYRRVIRKVAPGSQYENILDMLFERFQLD